MARRWAVYLGFVLALMGVWVAGADARPPDDWDSQYFYFSSVASGGGCIDWHDGFETLTMVVPLAPTRGSGWVVAIPCKAGDVVATLREHVPVYTGRTAVSALHGRLQCLTVCAYVTQIYPAIYWAAFPSLGYTAVLPEARERQISTNGLWCKVVSAESKAKLRVKVSREGIELPETDMERLGKLADGAHSFLLIGMNSVKDYEATRGADDFVSRASDVTPCVEVGFPSVRPLWPARATGSDTEWDILCVMGNVRPVVALPPGKVRQCVGGLRVRGIRYQGERAYTRVSLSDGLEEVDFEPETSAKMTWTGRGIDMLRTWPMLVALTVLWIGLCSYVSGGIAGLVIAQRWRGYAKLGLWNLATIVGLMVAAARARPGLEKLAVRWRRRVYVAVFSVGFVMLNVGADWFMGMVLGQFSP